jgi:hypothetical protein
MADGIIIYLHPLSPTQRPQCKSDNPQQRHSAEWNYMEKSAVDKEEEQSPCIKVTQWAGHFFLFQGNKQSCNYLYTTILLLSLMIAIVNWFQERAQEYQNDVERPLELRRQMPINA